MSVAGTAMIAALVKVEDEIDALGRCPFCNSRLRRKVRTTKGGISWHKTECEFVELHMSILAVAAEDAVLTAREADELLARIEGPDWAGHD